MEDRTRRHPGAMTPQEAGHLGGVAPHECRGFECQKEAGKGAHPSGTKSENE
jgi:hypothetical protein